MSIILASEVNWMAKLRIAKIRDSGSSEVTTRTVRDSSGKAHRVRVIDVNSKTFSRSEEHTSELQSLMRISYAVFFLNKKLSSFFFFSFFLFFFFFFSFFFLFFFFFFFFFFFSFFFFF